MLLFLVTEKKRPRFISSKSGQRTLSPSLSVSLSLSLHDLNIIVVYTIEHLAQEVPICAGGIRLVSQTSLNLMFLSADRSLYDIVCHQLSFIVAIDLMNQTKINSRAKCHFPFVISHSTN